MLFKLPSFVTYDIKKKLHRQLVTTVTRLMGCYPTMLQMYHIHSSEKFIKCLAFVVISHQMVLNI